MHSVRALLRVLVVLLAIGVGGGPALLDGCLVNCHLEAAANAAASGHCHDTSPRSEGLRLQSTSRCSHDHEPAWADASEARPGSHLKATLAIVSISHEVAAAPVSRSVEPILSASVSSPPPTVPTPLRL
jgi:hypothetical protein